MKFVRFVLFFLIFFSPLAFGTKADWSYGLMEALAGAGLLVFILAVARDQEPLFEVPGLVPLLIFLAYILFQVFPLPPVIVKLLSPYAFSIHSRAFELTDTTGWMTLSVQPRATVFHFFRYASYTAFYMLTVQVLKEKKTFKAITLSIAVFGGLLAFSSILQFYLTKNMSLWFWYTPEHSIIMGPYSNHNHYAGLMEMIFPLVLAQFFFYRPRIGASSFSRGIVEIFNQEKANIYILIGISALLVIVSIFVSLSRGGMVSTCLSMAVFGGLLLKCKVRKQNTLLFAGLILMVCLSVGWFGWDSVFERFVQIKNPDGVIYNARLEFWKDSSRIIRDFMLTGSGLGTFVYIYPPYKSLVDNRVLNHAHNDYIELLVEGGLVGFIIIFVFICVLFVKTFRMFSKRRDAFCVYLYIGSLTGMISILFHSVTDFNLQIGANGLWFSFLAGLAVASSHTHIRGKNGQTRLAEVQSFWWKKVFIGISLGFVAGLAIFQISRLGGVFYFSHIKDVEITEDTSRRDLDLVQSIAGKATAFDPLFAQPMYFQAVIAIRNNDFDTARRYFRAAICLAPLNSWYLKRFGRFSASQNEPVKAEAAFALAVQYRPTLPVYMLQYATWLLSTGKTDEAIKSLKKTLELDSSYWDKVIRTLLASNVPDEKIRFAIPEKPASMFDYAEFLYLTGRERNAKKIYLEILDLLSRQSAPEIRHFYRIYHFFSRQHDWKNAVYVMEIAELSIPDVAEFKITLGDLYRRQGILFKAREKYEQAVFIDPENRTAYGRIKEMDKKNKQY